MLCCLIVIYSSKHTDTHTHIPTHRLTQIQQGLVHDEARQRLRCLTLAAGTQAFRPLFSAFPDALAESWIGRRVAKT